MSRSRRKLSGPYRDFVAEVSKLNRLDDENQEKFSPGPGRPGIGRITSVQLYVLTEAIFFSAFRGFESFIRDIFLLYCLEVKPKSGRQVKSYLSPRSFPHAEKLIKSSMPFLDWSSPDTIIERSEKYLKDGFPIKDVFVSRLSTFRDMKHLRNHIAHNSTESKANYYKVLRNHHGVVPLVVPQPGKFLLEPDKTNPTQYLLKFYLDFLKYAAEDLV